MGISATGSEGFARVVRLLFGVPSVAVFLARLVLFGLVRTSAGAAPSTGFEMLLTAFTSVGIGVEEIAGLVYAVCGSSNGAGASGCALVNGAIVSVTGVCVSTTFGSAAGTDEVGASICIGSTTEVGATCST